MPPLKPEQTGHQWQTWWSLIGPRLAASEFRLHKNVVLAPLDEATFNAMKESRAPVPKLTATTDSYVVHYPPRDEVQSRHRMQIDVIAVDFDEACQMAQLIADRVMASLSLTVVGGRYHAEFRKARRADEKREYSGWSEHVTISPLAEPQALRQIDIQNVSILLEALERDPTAENAYIHLLSAWQLQSTAGSKPLQRSILQHYVLCMEAIVNGIMKKVRSDFSDKIRLEERNYAADFAESLHKRANKPEAIREASTKLREIALQNTIPSIIKAAELLDLPVSIAEQGKELYRFRSSSLSHPGRTEKAGLQKWLRSGPNVANICMADEVARAFLVSYCAQFNRTSVTAANSQIIRQR